MKMRYGLVLKTVFLLAASLLYLSGCSSTPANTSLHQSSNIAVPGTGMPDYPDRSR